jgi:signal transduction histidine kinase
MPGPERRDSESTRGPSRNRPSSRPAGPADPARDVSPPDLRDALHRTRADLDLLLHALRPAVAVLGGDLSLQWLTAEMGSYLADGIGTGESFLDALSRSVDTDRLDEDLKEIAARVAADSSRTGCAEVDEVETSTPDGRILRLRFVGRSQARTGTRAGEQSTTRSAEDEEPVVLVWMREVTRYRQLEQEVADISETERRRIGEDLHDMIASRLTAVSMRLQNLRYALEENGEAVHPADLTVLIDEVQRGAEEARTLSHALVPVPLYENTLAAALQTLAQKIDQLHRPHCRFVGDGSEPSPDSTTTGLHLYRIAYEAVQNAVQHANPTQIRIRLVREDDRLVLSVTDNGSGFCPEENPAPDDASEGLGLHLMQYRADLIGATLRFDPSPAGGTQVRCIWPVQEELPAAKALPAPNG